MTDTPNGLSPTLIVITGLPATGKRTLARSIGAALKIAVFTKDDLERSLRPCFPVAMEGGLAAYAVLDALAQFQLGRNKSAILTGVFSRNAYRESVSAVAEGCAAAFRPIECICSAAEVHRRRAISQTDDSADWRDLTWEHVQQVSGSYEPWATPRLTIDSMSPLKSNVVRALSYVASGIT